MLDRSEQRPRRYLALCLLMSLAGASNAEDPNVNEQRSIIHVGPHEGDFHGNDHRALQAAVDYIAGLGGGTVQIGSGRFTMRNSLILRDNVHIIGTPDETVLVPVNGIRVALVKDGDANQREITLARSAEFHIGDGVIISDDHYPSGFQVTNATITAKLGPATFRISRPLYLDYMVSRHAQAELNFPIVGGWNIKNVTIEGLTIEGNRGRTECKIRNGCRTGGIYLFECENVTIRHCTVRNYNGDGISFQVSQQVTVEDCLAEKNAGLGLHPGSGSGHPVVRRNRSINNGGDGLYVCWRVRHGLFENNELRNNLGVGISIGHKDTDNLFRTNQIVANAKAGVLFRKESEAMGAHRNVFEDNIILDNAAGTTDAACIEIHGHHYNLVFRRNTIGHSKAQPDRQGVLIRGQAKKLQTDNNQWINIARNVVKWPE